MKNNRYKKISNRSKNAMYRWDAHKFWNRESKKGYHREIKKDTIKELNEYYKGE